ncbi:MAG TPA: prolipoprotein diacylglyceryl transferase [Ruminococcus flavefaciens]|nr:prolipoprotein diacylglyceryl transferase [Ruminococcus flavefaciens]HQL99240.1 prolipoprotein diacylglyceryl transferase [Ruminococcus flavefaciens]
MNIERINDLTEIQFPKLGWTFHIDPTAFTIGSFNIQWYGIIIVLGLILALVYVLPRMKRFGLDADRAIDAIIGGVIGGIIGARAYYVLLRWDEYKGDIKAIFNTRNGGLAIYGGLIGAILVGFIICKMRKVKVLPMLDVVSIGFLIGQGIGRWGNFVNQECFGSNTSSFLGITGGRIQQTIIDQTAIGGEMNINGNAAMVWDKAVHPCFLYESVWCLLGFLVLSTWSKRRKYDGQIFLMYMAWYGAGRFVIEGLRTDSLMAGSLKFSQMLSALLVVVSVILQLVFFFRRKRDPERFVLYSSTEESRQLIEDGLRKRMGMSKEDAKVSEDIIGDDEPSDEAAEDDSENADNE